MSSRMACDFFLLTYVRENGRLYGNKRKYIMSKIAMISDTHLGVHGDSPMWHKISTDYSKWLSELLLDRGIKTIYHLGDVFNNRKQIGVDTIHTATMFFDNLKEFDISIIAGNHDCFHADNAMVNSVSILGNRDNIRIVDEPYYVINAGKRAMLCPWGFNPAESGEKYDVLFGHFEINSFKMRTFSVCEKGMEVESITSVAPRIFSGHFHLRDDRTFSKGNKITYVGCPYELDWGDYETTKGVYIYDFDTDTIEFIENTFSPRHYKIDASHVSNPDFIHDLKSNVPNNIIKLISDNTVSPETVDKLVAIIQKLKPIEFNCDIQRKTLVDVRAVCEHDTTSTEPEEALNQYVDKLDTPLVDKVKLTIGRIYNQAKLRVK